MSQPAGEESVFRPGDSPDDAVADAVARYIDDLTAGREVNPSRVLVENPGIGHEVLARLEGFVGLRDEVPAARDLGTLGDYTLRRQIGRGGMGVVYEAWESSMDRRVALKVLPPGIAADERALQRFVREARTAGQLNHPNVVGVHGMGVKEQTPYYAMELVEGETLAQVLRKLKDADPETETVFGKKDSLVNFGKLADAFASVAEGLQHAHSKGIIHRDIKPSNLILDMDGRLRILDFGLAHLEGQESLTISGYFVGTPLYMSPEQARRKKIPVDRRTDIYSLGATLYEMVTLRPPFNGKDHNDTLSQIIEREPLDPRKLNPRVPKDLETIVLKCLRKDAGDRYGTAEALGQDLRRFVRGDPIEARPQAGWEKLLRCAWRQKTRAAATLALVAALIAAAWLALYHHRELRRRTLEAYGPKVRDAVALLQLGSLGRRAEVRGSLGIDQRRKVLGRGHPREVLRPDGPDPVEDGVRLLQEAAASVPERPDAFYHLGLGLLLLEEEEEAAAVLEQITERKREFVPAALLLAAVHEHRGEKAAARALREQAARNARGSWAEILLAAEESARRGRAAEAEAAYSKLVDLESAGREPYIGATIEARIRRGLARLEIRDFFGALQDFTVSRYLWPQAAEPALLEAKAYHLLGNVKKAARLCDKLFLEARFRDEVALGTIALYVSLGDEETALAWAEKLSPGYLRELHRSFSLGALGRCEDAVAAARGAIALYPGDTDAYFSLANTLGRCLGRYEEALGAVEAALRLKPDDARTYFQRGALFWSWGKPGVAVESYRRSLELHLRSQDDATGGAAIRAELGLALVDSGQGDKGLEELEKASALDPADVNVHNNLGLALLKMGKLDDSLAALDRAAAVDPSHSFPRHNRGIVLERQGKLDEAIEEYRAAGPLLPRNQWACVDLGRVLARKVRLDEAFAAYSDALAIEPGNEGALRGLAAVLLGEHDGAPGPAIDRLVDAIDRPLEPPAKLPPLSLNVLALALAHAEKKQNLDRALEAALRGIEAAAGSGAFAGDLVRTLKHILELAQRVEPAGKREQTLLLQLPSFKAIDVLLDGLLAGGQVPDGERGILENLRGIDPPADTGSQRLAYLRGRLLERGGNRLEATENYAEAAVAEPMSPEPHVRLAECRLAAGDAGAAAAGLRSSIEKGLRHDMRVWELWAAISLRDLQMSAGELLADLTGDVDGFGEDIRWLLERLHSRETLRIDCGGEGVEVHGEPPWGKDRFFAGGYASKIPALEIAGTRDAAEQPLYRTCRTFVDGAGQAAYRVPLPRGRFRVTLHFAETWFQASGLRRFDVLMEKQEVLESHEPFAVGFAMADRQTFEVEVVDGILDIAFVRRTEGAQVCGIEIDTLD